MKLSHTRETHSIKVTTTYLLLSHLIELLELLIFVVTLVLNRFFTVNALHIGPIFLITALVLR